MVLIELADRVSTALKGETELKTAVSALLVEVFQQGKRAGRGSARVLTTPVDYVVRLEGEATVYHG